MSITNDSSTIMPSEIITNNETETTTTNHIKLKQSESISTMSTVTTLSKALNQEALDALVKRTGYALVQENGQRRYGPPPDWDSSRQEPDRGCEVFVGKIPRDCFEDELVPVLEKVGYIYEFRLMMEYSGYNRGYGFVMYTCREDAKKAVLMLNNYEIRKGRMIGLCRSVDNCRLFVGGIPKNKKREEILEEMKKVTDDVVNVIVYPSANDKTKNRGFAFVQYGSHRAAAVARRKLIPNRISLFGQPIAVDWAEPEPEVDEDVMAAVKVLYVRNLMLTTTEDKIRAEFEKIKEGSVERVKKMKDFAFVHFKEREDALRAMKIMNGSTIDEAVVEVTLSKPIDKTSYMKLAQNAQNSPLLVAGLDNDLNLLIGAPMINPAAVLHPATAAAAATGTTPTPNQLINIPLAFNDPNLQFHLPNHSIQPHQIQPIPMSALATASPLNLPNFSQFSHPISITPQSQFIPNVAAAFNPTDFNSIIQTYQTQPPNPTTSPQNKSTSANRNVLRSSPRHVVNGAHRSTYYNVVKGGALIAGRKQPNNDDLLYDFYSGIKPVPMLPINMPALKYNSKTPVEVLEELCAREGMSAPIYTLHTTSGYEPDGKEIGLFIYKVMMPSLFGTNQLSSNRLLRSIEEAKNDAAEFVLMQIYSNPQLQLQLQHLQQHQQPPQQVQSDETKKDQTPVPNNGYPTPANDSKAAPVQQAVLINGQYPDHLNEYQQIIPAQQYIIDPTGQYLMCQATE